MSRKTDSIVQPCEHEDLVTPPKEILTQTLCRQCFRSNDSKRNRVVRALFHTLCHRRAQPSSGLLGGVPGGPLTCDPTRQQSSSDLHFNDSVTSSEKRELRHVLQSFSPWAEAANA